MVTFGAAPALALRTNAPKDVNRLRSILLDNFWYTNFLADQPGTMEFQFDLLWKTPTGKAGEMQTIGEAAFIEPVLMINPALKEDLRMIRRLYTP